MSTIPIATTHHVDIAFEAAPVSSRMVATVIDYILFFAAMALMYSILDIVKSASEGSPILGNVFRVSYLLIIAGFILAPFIQEAFLDGQTIGKRILGIRVIALDGSSPSMGAFFTRWLTGLVELVASVGVIGLVSVVMTRYSQRLGDLVAGTVVVKIPKGVNVRSLRVDTASNHVVMFPGVRLLTDEDVRVIRDVLHSANAGISQSVATAIIDRTALRVATKIKASHELTSRDFLLRVLADFTSEMT
ncbi:MAG TPA: RDD family protein [Candidatus Didemnitutus sp.]|nr:RDD family protein [Candidatus Didemnitutus sp.]